MQPNKPRGLGKGLGAIFQEKKAAHQNDHVLTTQDPLPGDRVQDIPLTAIVPNPFQPRKVFNDDEILELAQSIRDKGLIQPLLIRKNGDSYQIVAGERRFRAHQLLGRATVQAIVREQITDREMREVAIIENIQRVQLNPLEEAQAYQELIQDCGLTHDQCAERLGKSRSVITNALRLLRLDEAIRDLVLSGKLSAGHARCLAGLPMERQAPLAARAVAEEWSVRRLEQECAQESGEAKAEKPKKPKEDVRLHPDVAAFVRNIEQRLGTKVLLEGTTAKGSLRINFVSSDDLNRIGELILGADTSA
jgi:ParB family transcriptional regulator, chromosome partitioning protein